MNLIDKWVAMRAVQGIDSVATLRDGDPVIRMSAVEHVLENLPETEPDTTTHDSIPVETGKKDDYGTSGECISRQAVTKFLNDWLSCLFENCHKQSASDLKMIIKDFKNLPSAQSERTCVNCGRTVNNGGWYADGGTRCPIEEHYALPKDGYCHLWEKRNVTDDDYPERMKE